MLIRRCAWHLKYRGYRILFGVASWRGLNVRFTDGLCRGCVARHRTEWRAARGIPADTAAPRPRLDRGRVAAALVAIGTLVFAARPLDHGTTLMSLVPAVSRLGIPPASVESPDGPASATPARRPVRTVARRPPQPPVRTASVAPVSAPLGYMVEPAVFRNPVVLTPAVSPSRAAARPLHPPVRDAGLYTQAP